LNLGRSVLAGALTLAILVVPIIIVATREALRGVPFTIREASQALGATRWETVRYQVIPAAIPGIMTGTILAISRALGETAPLITIGALTYVAFLPTSPIQMSPPFISLKGLLDPFTVLPIQIFNWVSRPQKGFHTNAAAGILVLLAITFLLNATALVIRYRAEKKLKW
jgi:phosphate transport system permease protein